ncbi:MAG: glycerol-3-phosphate dehydrogenase [Alphaproteobacteria bacterium]
MPRVRSPGEVGRLKGTSDLNDGGTVDLLVIGGGINGAGIARDAAGRGCSVLLCEQDDLAAATSSASSKLIHGGLRYLEFYEFRLVREALAEREVLLENAPHIIFPLRFVLPHDSSLRPVWMIRAGLFLYDRLGGRRRLPGSHGVDLRRGSFGDPLKPSVGRGFVYSDCWVDDSRLVVLNALDAAQRGATILTRTRCVSATRDNGSWRAVLRDARGGETTVRARVLVNAAGPWVARVLQDALDGYRETRLKLIKGSHIVVPRLYEGSHAYILQNNDRRIVFVIPYERRFSLIGTTEAAFDGDPAKAEIDAAETAYLCDAVGRYFAKPVTPDDVVWSYAGVRPLYDNAAKSASAVTRDYVLDLDAQPGGAPLLSVLGGKITTYRRLAEHAFETLRPHLPGIGAPWTARAPLPGGDLPGADFSAFLAELRRARSWLPDDLAFRLARAYGSRVDTVLGDARGLADLGHDFGAGLYEREVDYLTNEEWAMTAEDVLWRRSKLGLHVPPGTAAELDDWISGHRSGRRAEAR